MSEYDIFIRNDIYPDASSIFSANIKSVSNVKNDAIYVFDTNTLLMPYYSSSKNLESIKSIITYLIKKQQLYIPGQVAREFAANRPDRIKEIFQTLNQQINVIKEFKNFKYPILNEIPGYAQLSALEKEYNTFANDMRERYKAKVNDILKEIKEWTWNDPVSSIYQELFTKDIVVDPELDKMKMKKELEWRINHKIPPGYKDQSKLDDGIGDLLIWKTIMQIGTAHKKHLIFVSGEEKSDWLYKSEGQILYPRYELVSEYYTATEHSFHILKFSEFIELMSGTEELIAEIERIEHEIFHLDAIQDFHRAAIFEFNGELLENEKLTFGYLVNNELQLIKRMVELYINMNATKEFKIQDRFIDSLTMVHRQGFFKYEIYKRLMHMFTTSNWDAMSEEELEKYYLELQQIRQVITTQFAFIQSPNGPF